MIRILIPSFSSVASGKVVFKFECCFVLNALALYGCDTDRDRSHILGDEHVLLLVRFQVLIAIHIKISISRLWRRVVW
jgi:hypothetical protein